MSWGATLSNLRHGFSLQDAEARIHEWAQRGLVHYSEIETRTTRLVHEGSDHAVRKMPDALVCVLGCGWERRWKP